MKPSRIALFACLAVGLAVVVHDAATGGGIAGYLVYREIVDLGITEPTFTYVGIAIPFVLVPGFLLLRSFGKTGVPPMTPFVRRVTRIGGTVAGISLVAVAIFGVVRAIAVPGEDAPVVRVVLDATTPDTDPPSSARIVLRGTPRLDQSVDYHDVVSSAKVSHAPRELHTIVPMTAANWTQERPVQFVTDLGDASDLAGPPPLPGIKYRETKSGVLVPGAVPGYLVRAFAAQGIVLAPNARLHTTSARSAEDPWIGTAIVAGFSAFAILFQVFAKLPARRNAASPRPTPPR